MTRLRRCGSVEYIFMYGSDLILLRICIIWFTYLPTYIHMSLCSPDEGA